MTSVHASVRKIKIAQAGKKVQTHQTRLTIPYEIRYNKQFDPHWSCTATHTIPIWQKYPSKPDQDKWGRQILAEKHEQSPVTKFCSWDGPLDLRPDLKKKYGIVR